jgi:cytochrome c-type biogenesis protein CcmH/NrfG
LKRDFCKAVYLGFLNAQNKNIAEATRYYHECLALDPQHASTKELLNQINNAKDAS